MACGWPLVEPAVARTTQGVGIKRILLRTRRRYSALRRPGAEERLAG